MKARIAAAMVVFLFVLSVVPATVSPAVALGPLVKVPSGIRGYVPVTIANSQSSPTPAPFQQMVQIDSAIWASYEASNLQNVEFFYANGTNIPSWLESGNSNSATSTTYWLELAAPIPAHSSIIIYMGFASLTTNLFNGVTVGEAPQLSTQYAQYDNGAGIFSFYDNFAGTTLDSNWGVIGSPVYSVSDGFSFLSSVGGEFVYSTRVFSPGNIVDSQITDSLQYVGYVDFGGFVNLPQSLSYSVFEEPGNGEIHGIMSYQDGCCNVNGPVCGWVPSSGVFSVYTINDTASSFQYNYTESALLTTSANLAYPSNVLLASSGNNGAITGSLFYQWVRVRTPPPNGVMPTVIVASSLIPTAPYVLSSTVVSGLVNPYVLGTSPQGLVFFYNVTGSCTTALDTFNPLTGGVSTLVTFTDPSGIPGAFPSISPVTFDLRSDAYYYVQFSTGLEQVQSLQSLGLWSYSTTPSTLVSWTLGISLIQQFGGFSSITADGAGDVFLAMGLASGSISTGSLVEVPAGTTSTRTLFTEQNTGLGNLLVWGNDLYFSTIPAYGYTANDTTSEGNLKSAATSTPIPVTVLLQRSTANRGRLSYMALGADGSVYYLYRQSSPLTSVPPNTFTYIENGVFTQSTLKTKKPSPIVIGTDQLAQTSLVYGNDGFMKVGIGGNVFFVLLPETYDPATQYINEGQQLIWLNPLTKAYTVIVAEGTSDYTLSFTVGLLGSIYYATQNGIVRILP